MVARQRIGQALRSSVLYKENNIALFYIALIVAGSIVFGPVFEHGWVDIGVVWQILF